MAIKKWFGVAALMAAVGGAGAAVLAKSKEARVKAGTTYTSAKDSTANAVTRVTGAHARPNWPTTDRRKSPHLRRPNLSRRGSHRGRSPNHYGDPGRFELRIAFVVNDIETEEAGYTTTRLGVAAINRGHEAWTISVGDLAYDPDELVRARATRVRRPATRTASPTCGTCRERGDRGADHRRRPGRARFSATCPPTKRADASGPRPRPSTSVEWRCAMA